MNVNNVRINNINSSFYKKEIKQKNENLENINEIDKISKIKEQIQNGTYKIDINKTAEIMAKSLLGK